MEQQNATASGYVGTIQAETLGNDQIWFALTKAPDSDEWITIDGQRALFSMRVNTTERWTELAKLMLLNEALRDGLPVRVVHATEAGSQNDFDAKTVRILRPDLHS
ncbi:MAG: hypothetical protein AAF682_10255 [Planctomycetota bacterium]